MKPLKVASIKTTSNSKRLMHVPGLISKAGLKICQHAQDRNLGSYSFI